MYVCMFVCIYVPMYVRMFRYIYSATIDIYLNTRLFNTYVPIVPSRHRAGMLKRGTASLSEQVEDPQFGIEAAKRHQVNAGGS
jgi:hypothetical protein